MKNPLKRQVSADEAQAFDSISRNLIDELILADLPDLKGKKVLDIGSGNGDFTFQLYDRGALVKGLDISKEVNEIAKSKYPMLDFELGDITKEIEGLEEYDFVVLELVVMFIKDIEKAFENIKKALKPNGEAIVAIIHPFFVLTSLSSDLGLTVEGDKKYFAENVLKLKMGEIDLTYFSRSVSWYFNKFRDMGFDIVDLDEPIFEDKKIKLIPELSDMEHIPSILLFKLKK